MWLINTLSYELREFVNEQQPEYAILSHTWGRDEVTFPDMREPTHDTFFKFGFRKIMYTCREAQKEGIEWAWVDTCCIDKSSSAELSEAINSMFNWYRQSKVCYVHLVDLDDSLVSDGAVPGRHELAPCRWFTRGWCLQELLSPSRLVFYSTGWVKLSQDETFHAAIADITGIDRKFLEHQEDFRTASVAARMSWAAGRECTRVEDTAYCLLGIFDINMPLLYGEGKKAFRRLQEEIWKEQEDHSLLAWTVLEDDPRAWATTGVFAESPDDFRYSSDIVHRHNILSAPSSLTQRGMALAVPVWGLMLPFSSPEQNASETAFELGLDCTSLDTKSGLSMLVVGHQYLSHTFTRIATVGHLTRGKFGTQRAAGQQNRGGDTVFVKKSGVGSPRQCFWNRLDPDMGRVLITVQGLHFGDAGDSRPKSLESIRPLDLASVMENWPETTHCLHVLGGRRTEGFAGIAYPSWTRLVWTTTAVWSEPPSPTNPHSFELVLAGNKLHPNKPRAESLALRCGIYIPTPRKGSSGGEESLNPWVCLDLVPWEEMGQAAAAEEDASDLDTSEPALKQRKSRVISWAKQALRQAGTRTGDVARASASWGSETMHVVMNLQDTSGTGERPELRAPVITFRFEHTAARPAWMDSAAEAGSRGYYEELEIGDA